MVRFQKEASLFIILCFLAATFVLVGYYIFFRSDSASTRDEASANVASDTGAVKKIVNSPLGHGGATCPGLAYVGDNVCDDEYNTALCEFDGGDCCKITSDFSSCTACKCYATPVYETCYDFWSNCQIFLLGDGNCDDELNNPECFFDAGDCCTDDVASLTHCEKCICIASDLFCRQEELGNGICEDWNNSPSCGHDNGDCCDIVGNSLGYNNTCCDCRCTSPPDYPMLVG